MTEETKFVCPVIMAEPAEDRADYQGECYRVGYTLDQMKAHLRDNGWTDKEIQDNFVSRVGNCL